MKPHRYIEVGFNDLVKRDYIFVKDFKEAKQQCRTQYLKGNREATPELFAIWLIEICLVIKKSKI